MALCAGVVVPAAAELPDCEDAWANVLNTHQANLKVGSGAQAWETGDRELGTSPQHLSGKGECDQQACLPSEHVAALGLPGPPNNNYTNNNIVVNSGASYTIDSDINPKSIEVKPGGTLNIEGAVTVNVQQDFVVGTTTAGQRARVFVNGVAGDNTRVFAKNITFHHATLDVTQGNWRPVATKTFRAENNSDINCGALQVTINGEKRECSDTSGGIFGRANNIHFTGDSKVRGAWYADGLQSNIKNSVMEGAFTAGKLTVEGTGQGEADAVLGELPNTAGFCEQDDELGFAIDHSPSASTCQPHAVTITVIEGEEGDEEEDENEEEEEDDIVDDYTGTIQITTSSGHGDWTINTADGSLSNGTADDGAAQYSFVESDNGQIVLDLSNQHADDLTITVRDVNSGASTTSSIVQFRNNAFVVVPATVTGASGQTYDAACEGDVTGSTEVVAGRPHDLRAALCRRDPNTGRCGVADNYQGNYDLKAWVARDGDDPGGTAPALAGNSLPATEPAGNNLTGISFNAGVATLPLTTTDVGKYTVNLVDDTSGFAQDAAGSETGPRRVAGSSPMLTVRPFGFAVDDIQTGTTNNPGTDTPTGDVFAAAGEGFSGRVRAMQWQGTDDDNNDGVPDGTADLTDNTTTASYAWTTSLEATTPFEPAEGSLGNIGNGSLAPGDFGNGTATASGLTYSEVGSVTLRAQATNYLNTSGVDVTGTSGVVGRFIPDHFDVTANTPLLTPGCDTYSYLGQPLTYAVAPQVTITARNAGGATTGNYFDFTGSGGEDWWRLPDIDTIGAGISYSDDNMTSGVSLDTAATGHSPTTDNPTASGQVVTTFSGPLGYMRPAGGPPAPNAAPFDAALEVAFRVRDLDDVVYADNPFTFAIGFVDGDDRQRHGRLVLANAHGSELLDLDMPMATEYFAGPDTGFVTASGDTCTAMGTSAMTLSNYRDGLSAGDTAVLGVSLSGGSGEVTLDDTAPATGSVDVTGDLAPAAADAPWLQYDWDGDGQHDNNPTARATFGLFNNESQWIYQRELY